jgi:exocyst complex component 4
MWDTDLVHHSAGLPLRRYRYEVHNKALRKHEDELTRVLKDTMPGLVQGISENAVQSTLSNVGTDDRVLVGAGQHHRLLIKPDAFHVSILFQPTLAFLASAWPRFCHLESNPHESSSAVLDEFVLKVYLPQLEEKVSDRFSIRQSPVCCWFSCFAHLR